MKLTVGSLFSGIGGLELGLEMTGAFETRWQVEIDPWCRRVLAKHWPDVTRYEDIRTVDFAAVERVDVICGGFPCQDISLAGRGSGITGERSGLWREMVRAIRLVRPRYVIVENVAALLGRGMGTVCGDLAALGYDTESDCIPASAVGAPHFRDRAWIVAYSNGFGRERITQPHILTETRIKTPRRRYVDGLALAEQTAWESPPEVFGMDDGVSTRLDRNRRRGLGNAVVPQVAEYIGRQIVRVAS